MGDLRGRVAVVTGAASGIGFALAARLVAEGMKVVLRRPGQASTGERDVWAAKSGAEVTSVPATCRHRQVDAVDGLRTVAVVGGRPRRVQQRRCGGHGGKDLELGRDDWDRTLGINLMGAANGIRAFLPLLLREGEGHVVNTASVAGLVPAVLGDYSVTKHAVVALSEALYFDLVAAGSRVGVSVLCPGWVRTNIGSSQRTARRATPDPHRQAMRRLITQQIAAGMEPAEVAGQVVQAIRTGRFYITTGGGEWSERVRARCATFSTAVARASRAAYERRAVTGTGPAAAPAQGDDEIRAAGDVDVLIVGAGVSGIGVAYHLRERFPEWSFVILDALDNRGGTWWTHRYPGVRSDSDLFTYGYGSNPGGVPRSRPAGRSSSTSTR